MTAQLVFGEAALRDPVRAVFLPAGLRRAAPPPSGVRGIEGGPATVPAPRPVEIAPLQPTWLLLALMAGCAVAALASRRRAAVR